jgi:hypothetical protein
MTTQLKTLTLLFGPLAGPATQEVQCQLSGARLEPTYSDTTVQTFCGPITDTTEAWALILAGFQDWGDVTGVCDLLWAATDAGQSVDFVLTVGPTSFTGEVVPKRTVAGGDAGAAFTYEVSLPVQGNVTKAPAAPLADDAAELAAALAE